MLTPRHWRPELVLIPFVFVGLLGAAGLAAALHPRTAVTASYWDTMLGMAVFQIPALILCQYFLRRHGTNWRDGFGVRWERRPVLLGLAGALAMVLVGYPLQAGVAALLARAGLPAPAQTAVLLLGSATWPQRLLLGVSAVIIAPLIEEAMFRGILFQFARDHGWQRLAWIGTSILFGCVHSNLAALLPLALFGALLAWLYERTGCLSSCLAAHGLFNLIGFILAVTGWTPFS